MKRSIDRFQFLRGDFSGSRRGVRPPWSKSEALFTECCERCGACIPACPREIIRIGAGGFPVIDFSRGGCTFCGDCAIACRHDAFDPPDPFGMPDWQLDVVVTEGCLSLTGVVCRTCGDACQATAIRFRLKSGGRAQPLIDHQRCNGCGECFAACPARCISILPKARNCAA